MSATLDDLDAAIFGALSDLTRPTGDTFVSLARYAGEVTKTEGVAQEVLARAPAALLAFDGERGKDDVETLTGDTETVGTSTWTVLVVAADVRGTSTGLKGTPGAAGVYALADAVQGALNSLVITGLLRNERLAYQGTVPVIMQRGRCYVLAVRFAADRALSDARLDDTSLPYLGTTGKLHLTDDGVVPPADDPIDTFKDA